MFEAGFELLGLCRSSCSRKPVVGYFGLSALSRCELMANHLECKRGIGRRSLTGRASESVPPYAITSRSGTGSAEAR